MLRLLLPRLLVAPACCTDAWAALASASRGLRVQAAASQAQQESASAPPPPSPPPPPPSADQFTQRLQGRAEGELFELLERGRQQRSAAEAVADDGAEPDGDGAEDDDIVDVVNPQTGERYGPRGKEPTRFGDWEIKGRCSDF